MKYCPVCGSKLSSELRACANCGFDDSCNYESYITLTQVPSGTRSLAGRVKPKLDAEAFWRGRLEAIATNFIPLVHYNPNIPQKHLWKALKAAPKMMKICGDAGLRGTGDYRLGGDGNWGAWNVSGQSILAMICTDKPIGGVWSTTGSVRLFVTREALYIQSGTKRGNLALGYRNIADARAIQTSSSGRHELNVLLKDGSTCRCALDSAKNDWLHFDKLAEALLELRRYYE